MDLISSKPTLIHMNTLAEIQEKVRNAKELDFGDVFSQCIELFKKVWVQGLLLQLFTVIVMLPIIIILYIPLIGMMMASSSGGYYDPSELEAFFAGFSLIYIIFILAGIIVLGAVAFALKAGFFRIVKKLDHGEDVTTSEFFYFLKGKHLQKALVLVLISAAIGFVAITLCVLPIFYVMVPMAFFGVFYAFDPELTVGDMVSAGFALGNKKWLLVFGLMIVIGMILWLLSYITCGIGNLFLAAFMHLPVYIIYKEIIGFGDTSEIDYIGLIETF